MLHILLSFIPTRTPLVRKAILTLASKGLLHSHSQRWLWGLQGHSKHTDAALEEPFQAAAVLKYPNWWPLWRGDQASCKFFSPQPARPGGCSVLVGGSTAQLPTAGVAL